MILNIKGDLENITQRQLEFISDVVKEQKYAVKEVFLQNVGEKGDNYGSQVKRITAKFENGKELKMIAKVRPDNMKLRDETTNSMFSNEIIMLNKILPKFKELQEKCVPDEELFKYPHCYGTLDERDNEIILLEDLGAANFVTLDKTKPLDDEIVKLVLKNMANMHSLSYALARREPKLFNNVLNTLLHPFFQPGKTEAQMVLDNFIKEFDAIFKSSRYHKIIVEIMQDLFKSSMKLLSNDSNTKYSVIKHGDLWINNIMFQIQDNRPRTCTFIDYQLSRDGLPVSDILYFINNCTDYKTRSMHYHDWMHYYHLELDKYLSNFGLNVNNVYPIEKLLADLKRYAKTELAMSFFVLTFSLRSSEEAPDLVMTDVDGAKQMPDFKMGELLDKSFETINDRVEGVIESYFDFGYLTDVRGINL